MCDYNFLKYKYFQYTNYADKQYNHLIRNKPFLEISKTIYLHTELKIKILLGYDNFSSKAGLIFKHNFFIIKLGNARVRKHISRTKFW